jgi:hypothetical protein
MKITAVFGGTYHQARNYGNPIECRPIHRFDQLRGIDRGSILVMVGTWRDNPEAENVLRMAAQRGLKVIYE